MPVEERGDIHLDVATSILLQALSIGDPYDPMKGLLTRQLSGDYEALPMTVR